MKKLYQKWARAQYCNIPTRLHVRPAMTQIRLRIRAVWSESSQGTLWIAKDPKRLQVDSEDPDKPARIRTLIWVFAGRPCNLIGNALPQLKYNLNNKVQWLFSSVIVHGWGRVHRWHCSIARPIVRRICEKHTGKCHNSKYRYLCYCG